LFVSKAYQAVCSGAVGDIKYSLLPPDKFKDVNGDCWVPLDGRTLSSTDALYLYQQGVTTLPNAGGTFIRTQDFAASTFTESSWTSVAYGNDLWVAVATSGTRRVMTSPNGINWTNRYSAANNNWTSVAYGNGLFVAVSNSGSGNRVMTSPDGITWTSRTSAADNSWNSVAYGNGRFVAASTVGLGNRVMTSTNGVSWTTSQTPDERWNTLNSSNADPERSAATAPGTLQNSDFQSHTHATALDGAHTHAFDRRANAISEDNGTNNDTSVKSTDRSVIGSSTTSTDGTHTHTMNANSDGGNANETRPVNLNLWVYIRIK
jgi:hypothetical protein